MRAVLRLVTLGVISMTSALACASSAPEERRETLAEAVSSPVPTPNTAPAASAPSALPVPGSEPQPEFAIVATPEPGGPGFALRVENRGDRSAGLLRALRLERRDGADWVAVKPMGHVWIRANCDAHDGTIFWPGGDAECVPVQPHTSLVIPPWIGTVVQDTQCGCEACRWAPSGTYRFVATRCSGEPVYGTPFAVIGRVKGS